MGTLKRTILIICLVLSGTFVVQTKEWNGIVPLHSTRADVERILGPSNGRIGDYKYSYKFNKSNVYVSYARGKCSEKAEEWQEEFQVPKDTVQSISIFPTDGTKLKDLKIDVSNFKKHHYDSGHLSSTIYVNEEGFGMEAYDSSGLVIDIFYFPSAKEYSLLCPGFKPFYELIPFK